MSVIRSNKACESRTDLDGLPASQCSRYLDPLVPFAAGYWLGQAMNRNQGLALAVGQGRTLNLPGHLAAPDTETDFVFEPKHSECARAGGSHPRPARQAKAAIKRKHEVIAEHDEHTAAHTPIAGCGTFVPQSKREPVITGRSHTLPDFAERGPYPLPDKILSIEMHAPDIDDVGVLRVAQPTLPDK